MNNHGEILIYQTEDGLTKIDVNMKEETVWLSLEQMTDLFQRDKSTISRHIKNIFEDGELVRSSVVAIFATAATDGKTYQVDYYNLDVIISVGYRVKSQRGVQFRIWASNILKEYIKKGFAMDDERLKELGGGGYFKELLDRIRDIRASEKVFYRQVLEIYATSVDYNPTADVSIQFFKRVQNKIHYAVSGKTAVEVIYHRADAEKEFMRLMTFSGGQPTFREAKVAKNYLDEKELRSMRQLVSGYLDFAERQAERKVTMTMEDWAKHLDGILTSTGENLLTGNGTVSHLREMDKAEAEYKKYTAKTISSVEKDYLDSIKMLEKKGEGRRENYHLDSISKDELIRNLDKVHTTKLGVARIKKNLSLDVDDVIKWCKLKIELENPNIERQGKNWYVTVDDVIITVNAYSFTIITAHKVKK